MDIRPVLGTAVDLQGGMAERAKYRGHREIPHFVQYSTLILYRASGFHLKHHPPICTGIDHTHVPITCVWQHHGPYVDAWRETQRDEHTTFKTSTFDDQFIRARPALRQQ